MCLQIRCTYTAAPVCTATPQAEGRVAVAVFQGSLSLGSPAGRQFSSIVRRFSKRKKRKKERIFRLSRGSIPFLFVFKRGEVGRESPKQVFPFTYFYSSRIVGGIVDAFIIAARVRNNIGARLHHSIRLFEKILVSRFEPSYFENYNNHFSDCPIDDRSTYTVTTTLYPLFELFPEFVRSR